MDVKKEGIGIIATILLIIPLAAGGYWVVKSLTNGPTVSKADTFSVSNHGLVESSVHEKETSELAHLFDEEKEEMTLTGEEKEEKVEDVVVDEILDDSGVIRNDEWVEVDDQEDLSGNNTSTRTNDAPATSSPANHNPPTDKQTKEDNDGVREERETSQSEGGDHQDESDKTSADEDGESDEHDDSEKDNSDSDDTDGEKQEEETEDNMDPSDEPKEKKDD